MLVANLTRPVINGVSVLVLGIRLGLQFSKTDDKHGNVNGEPSEATMFEFNFVTQPSHIGKCEKSFNPIYLIILIDMIYSSGIVLLRYENQTRKKVGARRAD